MNAARGSKAAALYHRAIVDAARRGEGAGRLARPDATASADNPLCGDRVSVDVHIDAGRLRAIAHRVRGCLLCEASASIIAANAIGASAEDLGRVQATLAECLNGDFSNHDLPWDDLQVFAPVAAHRSRHRCVTLAFEALTAAMAAARDRQRAPGGTGA